MIDEKLKRIAREERERANYKEALKRFDKELIDEMKKKYETKIKMRKDIEDEKKERSNRLYGEMQKEFLENQRIIKELYETRKREKEFKESVSRRREERKRFLDNAARKTASILSIPNPKFKLIANNHNTSLPMRKDNSAERRQRLEQEMLIGLNYQVREKGRKRLKEWETKKIEAEYTKNQVEQYKRIAKTEMNNRLKTAQANSKVLLYQMYEKKLRDDDLMTKDEYGINRRLVDKANNALSMRQTYLNSYGC